MQRATRSKEFAEKPGVPCENGPTAHPRCEDTGSAVAPCSRTCRLRSGFQPAIRCVGSASWPIKPSIDSIPPSASSTPQKAGHRCRPSSCCWPRCCRRSTGSARSGCLLEQLHYNLLLRWFVGLSPDDPIWHPTTFTLTSAVGRSCRRH